MIRILILMSVLQAGIAEARILVEENGKKVRHNYDRSQDAQKVGKFWQSHKVGLGLRFGGSQGVIGGNLAINFHPEWGTELSFGGSPYFQSFGIRVKRLLLTSSQFNPFFALGFSRWLRTKGPVDESNLSPSFLVEKLMSEEERRLGKIDVPLVTSALGLQYIFTDGEFKGLGLSLEANLLFDAKDYVFVPTGSVGMNYYF